MADTATFSPSRRFVLGVVGFGAGEADGADSQPIRAVVAKKVDDVRRKSRRLRRGAIKSLLTG